MPIEGDLFECQNSISIAALTRRSTSIIEGLSSLERLAEISKSSGRNHILYEGNAAGINIRALHQRRHAISRRQRAGGRLVLQGEEALCEADVATMEVLQAVEWKSTH